MARWKLTQKHYLNVPGTLWEYTENDRATGRPKRKQFPVPRFLDPDDTSDWNYIDMRDPRGNAIDGSIVVAWEGSAKEKDLVFEGQPTPDMVPLDDEAKEISSKLKVQVSPDQEGGFAGSVLENRQQSTCGLPGSGFLTWKRPA